MLKVKFGDTLVEVLFAIAVFSLVSVLALNVMSAGLKTTEGAMEVAQSRSEIDAQAESLRFIHNAFTLERELVIEKQQYRTLWKYLTDSTSSANNGMANEPDKLPELSVNTCDEVYDGGNKSIFKSGLTAFIIDTRNIDQSSASKLNKERIVISTRNGNQNKFTTTKTYPRVLYTTASGSASGANNSEEQIYEQGDYRYVAAAEGIYIIAIRDRSNNAKIANTIPEFFDFHIRACWYSPDRDNPTTIGTIIRLYNPEIVEDI